MNDTVRHELAPTGVLRAVINLGNPVLAQGTPEAPAGITVDLARALAAELDVPVELHCVDAARKSVDAIASGQVDVGFVAIDPGRAEQLAFTEPYVLIEGVYAVPADSPIASVDDVDRAGVRIGAKLGSAYDLHLGRQLRHAEVVRGDEGTEAFEHHGLEVAAGIRQPLAEYVATHPGMRVLEPAFMQIRQAMAVSTERSAAAQEHLRGFVEARKADGFVAAALARAGQDPALAAPAA